MDWHAWERSAPLLLDFNGWTKGGVPGGIRPRGSRTAAPRTNHLATSHPYFSTLHTPSQAAPLSATRDPT